VRRVEAFERSLQLYPDNMGKNIRAWTGESLAYNALGLYEDEVRCCLCALEARIARHFLLNSSINITIRKVRPSCVPSKQWYNFAISERSQQGRIPMRLRLLPAHLSLAAPSAAHSRERPPTSWLFMSGQPF
jgi:hypothetical protein